MQYGGWKSWKHAPLLNVIVFSLSGWFFAHWGLVLWQEPVWVRHLFRACLLSSVWLPAFPWEHLHFFLICCFWYWKPFCEGSLPCSRHCRFRLLLPLAFLSIVLWQWFQQDSAGPGETRLCIWWLAVWLWRWESVWKLWRMWLCCLRKHWYVQSHRQQAWNLEMWR